MLVVTGRLQRQHRPGQRRVVNVRATCRGVQADHLLRRDRVEVAAAAAGVRPER